MDHCYSSFKLNNHTSNYETNGITRDEFCGGRIAIIPGASEFEPIEIEIFEIKDEAK